MQNLSLEEFNPTVFELTNMATEASKITATDLRDKKQIESVKTNRLALGKARINITKIGKKLREDVISFQRAVLSKEKELLAIIEPEETRLKKIEEESELLLIMDKRRSELPVRIERLNEVHSLDPYFNEFSDSSTEESFLLSMDNNQFEAFFNQEVATKNYNISKKYEEDETERIRVQKEKDDADRAEIARQQKIIDDKNREIEMEQLRLKHEKELAEAAEKARIQAEERAKETARVAEEMRVAEAKRQKELAEAKRLEDIRVENERKEALARESAFIAFKELHGWTKETEHEFIFEDNEDGSISMYKLLGVYGEW